MTVNYNDDAEDAPGTILESDDEIRRAQEMLREQRDAATPKKERPFRPLLRPPVADLTVCDDGRNSGEVIRIRDEQFVVGRTEGDLVLPFDELLSSRHFAINRHHVKGSWRWVVTDLQSRNGLFFRILKAPLNPGTQFLIGSGCYEYQVVQQASPETSTLDPRQAETQKFLAAAKPGTGYITEVIKDGIGARMTLEKQSYRIGSSTENDFIRSNDRFTKSVHATLTRSERGTWVLENAGSFNGVWISLPQLSVRKGGRCDFQAGEQRFRLSVGAKR